MIQKIQLNDLAAIAENNGFIPMVIGTPKILSDKVHKAKPISTNYRHKNKENVKFMQNKITDLLKKGLVRFSTSPWRAQAFDVKSQK